MWYNDFFNQNYAARNTSGEPCLPGPHNWWGNSYGPDDFSDGGCPYEYNPNAPYPKVDDKVSYSQWENHKLAIELEEFKASPYSKQSIILEWSTGSEQDNAGFYLVKSQKVDSDYFLLNNKMIPAKGNTVGGANYSYIDDHVSPYTLYFYWLVDVSYDGKFKIHGPDSAVYISDPIIN